MASDKGNSEEIRDAPCLLVNGLPSIGPNPGKLAYPSAIPVSGHAILNRSEGGSLMCKGDDPRHRLSSGIGAKPLQPAPSQVFGRNTRKVYVKIPQSISAPKDENVADCSTCNCVGKVTGNDLKKSVVLQHPVAYSGCIQSVVPSNHSSPVQPFEIAPVDAQQPLMQSGVVHSCCKHVAALLQSAQSQHQSPALVSALGPTDAAALGSVVNPVARKSYADAVNSSGATVQQKSGPVPSIINLDGPYNPSSKSFHDDTAEVSAFGQLLDIDGRKVVSFSEAEFNELVVPFRYSLVGKFSFGFPSMKTLRVILGSLKLKNQLSVSLLEEKHVLIHLSCEEDYTRLWCRQIWHIAGYPMRVFKWTPDFSPQFEAPYAPVWVLFPYLPVHLFDKRSLFIIASSLGEPLRIDSATAALTRASTARVCIEIDVTKTLLPEVEIQVGGKTIFQAVEYENIPKFCSCCKHFGHISSDCKMMIKSSVLETGGTGTQADKVEGTEPTVAEPAVLAACAQPNQVQAQPSAIIPVAPLTGAGMIIPSLPETATQQFETVPSPVAIAGGKSNNSKDFDGHNYDIPESSKCREYMIQSKSSHKAAGDQSWPSSPRSYDPDEVAIYLDDNNGELHLIDHQTLEISRSPNRGGAVDDLSENYSSKIGKVEDWKKWKGKKNEPLTSRSIEEMEEKPPDEGERVFKVVSKKKGKKKK